MSACHDPGMAPESDAASKAFLADPGWVHCAGHIQRPGLFEFMRDLEWTHYPPDGPNNDNFQIRLVNWSGLQWAIVSVPAAEKHLMAEAAARNGLRLAEGTSIIMVSGDGMEKFPWSNDRLFPLQPATKSNNGSMTAPTVPTDSTGA